MIKWDLFHESKFGLTFEQMSVIHINRLKKKYHIVI